VGNIVTGVVFYDETNRFTETSWAVFLWGISLLFLGVWFTNHAAALKSMLTHPHPKYGLVLEAHEERISILSAQAPL